MSDLSTQDQLEIIRRVAATDFDSSETRKVRLFLRALLVRYDAVVEQHASELSHANSNADNLRVQVMDLMQTVQVLKNVILRDEEQGRLL